MDDRIFYYKISPEVIKNKVFLVNYTGDSETTNAEYVQCCDIYTSAVTRFFTGQTYAYSSMTQILSGGTTGDSLLNLTIPIFLTETTIDVGYYSVFDGMVIQQDTMTNFLFSSTTSNPYNYLFYNTSDTEFKKYLSFSDYKIDWGDGSPIQTVNDTAPNNYVHTYTQSGNFVITMSGMSPWGVNLVKKHISVPYSAATITNPNGTAYFIPAGGSWSATPISYDYIFSGDSICDVELQSSENYTTIPIMVSGYTYSSLSDLQVYGKSTDTSLYAGKYRLGIPVKIDNDTVGTFLEATDTYTAYTINEKIYHDFPDGTTVFIVKSSGITSDMLVCSAITKNEALINVIDEPEVQSDVFIERGKQSGLESVIRLGEVDNVGDLEKYGYGFFKVNEI
jgi:hypothetical protein